ncbi:hypothetical protein DW352_18700 [Pseudolabrys taiwanensis]|uniref:Uncharacterized protein n=1 Tax=Pseudolabrys taiwanensis TaxID=331696 RepID=A0A345ZZL8_9HYPH|nr:hypothetical protein [Pseudolabrys taiwanensis]AXK82365.1 hypothetical protein DW352_18700 [Pseudolabrys taiwanensis]
MRKALFALPLAAAAAFATPALAQPYGHNDYASADARAAAPWVLGTAAGTAVALGAYNGWYTGWGAAGAALPTSAVGAAAVGGVAAMGTVAFIGGWMQPCSGFQALFDLNHGRCVNGQYVGDRVSYNEPGPDRPYRRHHHRRSYR